MNRKDPIAVIVDALSAAADNAHDMRMADCDGYAIRTITEDLAGRAGEPPMSGYFGGFHDLDDPDEYVDCPYTVAELAPYRDAAIAAYHEAQRT